MELVTTDLPLFTVYEVRRAAGKSGELTEMTARWKGVVDIELNGRIKSYKADLFALVYNGLGTINANLEDEKRPHLLQVRQNPYKIVYTLAEYRHPSGIVILNSAPWVDVRLTARRDILLPVTTSMIDVESTRTTYIPRNQVENVIGPITAFATRLREVS